MSSTSSSACECDEYNTYNLYSQGSYARTPFYPTMGHPLINYAQMPEPSKRQRSRENRKNKQNWFAKALRWYREEHVPYRSDTYNKTDMNGFAAWLNSKYEEFLQENQLDSTYHIKMKQTPVIEAERMHISPWRRKRPASKEASGINQKTNQSFQFILQPKDLMRPASECCQSSNATMISTELPMRSSVKPQSYTLLSQQGHLPESAGITTFERNKTEKSANEPSTDVIYVKELSQNKELHNISCQCSVPMVVKINVQTQYEDADTGSDAAANGNEITPRPLCLHCQKLPLSNMEVPKASVSSIPKEVQVKGPTLQNPITCHCAKQLIPNTDVQIIYQTQPVHVKRASSISNIQSSSKIPKTYPCDSIIEEIRGENYKEISSATTFSNDVVQTSDHSIRLEKDATDVYPLFMKIVCADRLSK